MKLGSLTAAWSNKSLEEVLDYFAANGLTAVEIGAGAYPGKAHCDPTALNRSPAKRAAFAKAIESRGLVLSALSVHGNSVHPKREVSEEHHEAWRQTIRLASSLGVTCVNNFSGQPAGAPGDSFPASIYAPWPDEHLKAWEYQWGVAAKYWKAEAKLMEKLDVLLCVELHPNMLGRRPEDLVRLREVAESDRICANFDPSHLFWQGIYPPDALRWLHEKTAKGARSFLQHFHAKDSLIYEWNARVNGVLDPKSYGDEINRGWLFRTVGYGNGAEVWKDIISTLRMCGYDGVLSIEHEDSLMSSNEGFLKAIAFLKECAIFEERTAMTWAAAT